jgi:flagellar biosynthesis/type III secretory pathway protein FliH
MIQMPTIHLRQPVVAASIVDAAPLRIADCGLRIRDREPVGQLDNASLPGAVPAIQSPPLGDPGPELQQQKDELDRLLRTVGGIADSLRRLYEKTLEDHRAQIARLAVEIARRILMDKVGKGDYEIQAIVEEALKRAPTRQNVVVRLHPEDVSRCQQLQQADPQSPLAELELAADWNIGRGECLVETPKGIVQSFIEEHLEHISEALQKVE